MTSSDLPAPAPITHNQVTLVRKDTRSVAWSLGYPIDVKRGDPDFPALLVMPSWLGQHRESGGRLFARMRELRGLNYGDYAYIEYFPRGMFRFDPQPNLARHEQIFQIWIRPLEPPNAVFALRLAMFELSNMVKNGIPEAEFEKTRSFLSKYVNILTKTKSAELGYAIDSEYYGIPNYNEYMKNCAGEIDGRGRECRDPPAHEGGEYRDRGRRERCRDASRRFDRQRRHADSLQLSEAAGCSR